MPETRSPVLPDHGAGFDRQLHRGQTQGFARDLVGHAVDFEHHAARLDLGGPAVDRTLTFTHTNFDRLGRDRNVRENADPDTALTLHVTRHGTTGGFDLACGHTLRLESLQAVGAEVQVRATLGLTLDPALVHLAEFCALRL
ncbi:hypothetical protein RB2654_11148 [Rhodobacterales bacterium HTCC2654]|uniref:Uncharacterized protein n=1 Tax=Maritimibacter alkaliphilus HTCC2654 TaxID=314271 RepID=A3VFD5_9RHOB|nr:hypothetical protein RB2654_11148 [Rhodobacterales bacterium HTCC2654] [Maritimibacter alkaliphilus HTCC2654]